MTPDDVQQQQVYDHLNVVPGRKARTWTDLGHAPANGPRRSPERPPAGTDDWPFPTAAPVVIRPPVGATNPRHNVFGKPEADELSIEQMLGTEHFRGKPQPPRVKPARPPRNDERLPMRKVAELLNRDVKTLRRWEQDGWISFHRTAAKQRYLTRAEATGLHRLLVELGLLRPHSKVGESEFPRLAGELMVQLADDADNEGWRAIARHQTPTRYVHQSSNAKGTLLLARPW